MLQSCSDSSSGLPSAPAPATRSRHP
jgi:hypothetical protein